MNKLVALTIALPLALGGCVAPATLAAVGGGFAIAKDVFDIDVDIHDILGTPRPAAPVSLGEAITNPAVLLDGRYQQHQ